MKKVTVNGVDYHYNIEDGEELADQVPAKLLVALEREGVFHPSRVPHMLQQVSNGVPFKTIVGEEVSRIKVFEELVGERDLEARLYSEWSQASVFLKEICRNIRRVVTPSSGPIPTAACSYRASRADGFSGEFLISFNRRYLAKKLANRPSGFPRLHGTSEANIQTDTAWGTHVHEMSHFALKHVGPNCKMTESAVLDNFAQDLAINGTIALCDPTGSGAYGHSGDRSDACLSPNGLIPGWRAHRPSDARSKELSKAVDEDLDDQVEDLIEKAKAQGTSEEDIEKLRAHFYEKVGAMKERIKASEDPNDARSQMRTLLIDTIAGLPPLMSSGWYADQLRKAVEDAGGKWTDTGIKLPGDPDDVGEEEGDEGDQPGGSQGEGEDEGDGEGDGEGQGNGNGKPGQGQGKGKGKAKPGKGKGDQPSDEPSDEEGEGEGKGKPGKGNGNTPNGHKPNELTLQGWRDDDHGGHDCDGDPEAEELAKNILRRAARAADQSSNGWGNMPSAIRERIRQLVHGGVSWEQELRQWVGQRSNGRDRARTIKRLDRKQPLVQSGLVRNRGVKILVILDESGSVGQDLHNQLYGCLDDLSKRKTFKVAPFDTAIAEDGVFEWKRGMRPVLKRVRCGGTDFDAAFEWAQKEIKRGDYHGVIVMTDGGCGQPRPLFNTQVLWVLGPDDKLPFAPRNNERVINIRGHLRQG